MKPEGLWAQVGNKCLSCALALLESETVPAAGTAETVRILVETAVYFNPHTCFKVRQGEGR